ncbi:MAG: thioredoxin family protein [Candidatus Aminicenantes bacterium]|nr:MAG: thioredoxin family protein [Candidatus Aminicenantes bacterium]
MECPHCNEYAPDTNYRCPHCGNVLQPDKEPSDYFPTQPRKRSGLNPNIVILLVIIVGLVVLIFIALFKGKGKVPQSETRVSSEISMPSGEEAEEAEEVRIVQVINADNPGAEIDIRNFIEDGKTTIFDFYSEFCGPCLRLSPLLKRLHAKRKDIVVHQVDINRPGVRGIDWGSPVSRQYNLRSIPHFMIYDSSGALSYQGKPAYQEVVRLLQSEGIVR